jgi:hypothetical protein
MNELCGRILPTKGISEDTKIYRTISVERLFQLFEDNSNVVVRPKLWDDTFENLALQSVLQNGDDKGTFGFKDDIYGQCWTSHTASDAIWRIYSQGSDGIRIRSTIGKLFNSLAKSKELGGCGEAHIGKVSYHSDTSLNQFAASHFKKEGMNTSSIAQTLMVKRNAFPHEKEIRIIYQSDGPTSEGVLKYTIDPHSLIDQIMLHPQLDQKVAERLKSRITGYLKYTGRVKRSLLYAPPKDFLFQT